MTDKTADILAQGEACGGSLGRADLSHLLSLPDFSEDERALFDAAYRVKCRTIGRRVSVRGLVEAGNVCRKDCFYCGIRASNKNVSRYTLAKDDIVRLAHLARELDYGSIVIQAGEEVSDGHAAFIEDVLKAIAPLDLGVTLSLGEQSEETYRRWREAGASRYLLRIETSDPVLYAHLHPASHRWEERRACLDALRRLDYQVGTGVMCALPGQTADDLARDILFYREIDADMIGMGPYIPHPDTPLAAMAPPLPGEERLHLALRMIAATRLLMHDVNIASSTALQALAADGREQGLRAGANVLMPNITDVEYRAAYRLYAGKPCLSETAAQYRRTLDARLKAMGEEALYGERGDSLHYAAKSRRH